MKYIILISVTLLFSGCAVTHSHLKAPNYQLVEPVQPKHNYKRLSHRELIGLKQIGIASYYGPQWNGRTTANGERLNLAALTAAHKSLPFNTLVRVTDLDTGKSIVVRVNDRGPYVRGRIIDLTDGAAARLGILHKGIARVKLEVIG